MKIQIKSDGGIETREELEAQVGVLEDTLSHYSDHITRLEVRLKDENKNKADKRCLLEARLDTNKAIAVSFQASTIDQAIDGAALKLRRSIESSVGNKKMRFR